MKAKKTKQKPQKIDNLAINASFDEVIKISMSNVSIGKNSVKQNVTPKKKKSN